MSSKSRRSDIIATARALFTTRGYDGTPIGHIAAEMGISKAAITYHFPAKADFLTELFGSLIGDLAAVLDRAEGAEWPDGIRTVLFDYLTVLIADHDLARWADTDLALQVEDEGPGNRIRALDQQLAQCITQGSAEREDHMRALAVIGGLWRPLLHESAAEITHHIDEIVDAAMISYAPIN